MRESIRGLFQALRLLGRAPAFTLTVLLTLGLTLGLNTAVFSAIDAIVFEPLPFPSADRLMFVTQSRPDTAETNVAPAVIAAARARLGELEPTRAVYEIAPLTDQIGAVYRTNALRTLLLGVFAIAALALACIGLYGTLSYVVNQRHREVGLRMALGAKRDRIVAEFVAVALRVVVIATVVGAAVFLASARGLSGMLYGISPWDPLTLVSVVLLMIGITIMAAALPAWRASRVDPMTVLREE